MPNHATPIETVYKGYRFRSRLEARWAVFLDALSLAWEYEKEGFVLPGGRYLPDFWLPLVNMWAEVKPEVFTQQERLLAADLAKASGYPVLMLVGIPEDKAYKAIEREGYDVEYCLTNYRNYPRDEHRFYCMPGDDDDSHHEDTRLAAEAARSARFEYGEHP